MRGKNKKERLGGLFKGLAKGVDEVLLSGQKVIINMKPLSLQSMLWCEKPGNILELSSRRGSVLFGIVSIYFNL